MMTRLATCSYAAFRPTMGRPVRISLGLPKWPLAYDLPDEAFWPLTPRPDYFSAVPEVFDRCYRAQLARVGMERLQELMQQLDDGRRLVFLCFERNVRSGADCHRRLFAEHWLQQTEMIPEISPETED